ncbi:glycoside hydrolase family 75 protein [Streptomyces sp. NPDC004542]|uniref:glycoside hydrolase family 75 protein n=1 Tax=Streptomyces sp. NPDC004542 TaxID=3154281 RepID=UPI0033A19082
MRAQALTLAAAGAAALFVPATLTEPAAAVRPGAALPPAAVPPAAVARGAARPGAAAVSRSEGRVPAADLLARLHHCAPVSHGRYRTDSSGSGSAKVRICGTDEAVFWTADMDIDCDGRPTARCNRRTDPLFSAATAFHQSDGRHLSAEHLPYIVVPARSHIWNPHANGVRGGSVAAVVYRDTVRYAVVGDTGPRDIIGEASYATARGLGIPADPRTGGAASGVTYIVFKDSPVAPIEDHAEAVATGERLARRFVRGG